MKHCWHESGVQHLVMNHRDVVCCWCGKSQCQSDPADEHGDFAVDHPRAFSSAITMRGCHDDDDCSARPASPLRSEPAADNARAAGASEGGAP